MLILYDLPVTPADDPENESQCAGLLEWLGVPYAGSPPRALILSRSKPLAKYVMRGAGLPTPDFFGVEHRDPSVWPIVTYDTKWNIGTRGYDATPPRYPAHITTELAERSTDLASKTIGLLGCRDYARVDFHLRPAGTPTILEVDPNPCASPLAGLAGQLGCVGIDYSEFVVGLVRVSLARGVRRPPTSIHS